MPKKYKRQRPKPRGTKTKADNQRVYNTKRKGKAVRLQDVKPSDRATQRYPQLWTGKGTGLFSLPQLRRIQEALRAGKIGEALILGKKEFGDSIRLEQLFRTHKERGAFYKRLSKHLRAIHGQPPDVEVEHAGPKNPVEACSFILYYKIAGVFICWHYDSGDESGSLTNGYFAWSYSFLESPSTVLVSPARQLSTIGKYPIVESNMPLLSFSAAQCHTARIPAGGERMIITGHFRFVDALPLKRTFATSFAGSKVHAVGTAAHDALVATVPILQPSASRAPVVARRSSKRLKLVQNSK